MPNKNKSARERAMELMLRNANNGTKNTIRRDGSTKPGSTVSSNQTNTATTSQSTSTSQSTNSSTATQKSSQTAHTTSQGGSQGTSYSDKFYHAAGRKYTNKRRVETTTPGSSGRGKTTTANSRRTTTPRHRVDDEVKSDRPTLVVGGAGKQFVGGHIAGVGTAMQQWETDDKSILEGKYIGGENGRKKYNTRRSDRLTESQAKEKAEGRRMSKGSRGVGVSINDFERVYDVDPNSLSQKLIKKGDEWIESGGQDIEQAKEGLGTLGKVGVDLVANGVQMLGDRALAFVPVVGQALAMGSLMNRAGGTASYEGRQSGMNADQQYQYALGTSVIEGLSEAMFNSVSAFKSTYGKGALSIADNLSFKTAAKNIVQNVLKSDTGRAVAYNLARLGGGALEEGTEELVAGITEPALKYMIMKSTDPNATYDVNLKDLGYDFMIGALMGGIPGSVDMIRGVRADVNLANSEAYKAFEDGNAFAQQYMDRAMVQGRVKDNGRILKTDAEVLAEKMQKQIDNGGQILPGQARRLMEALNESYTTNETSFRNKRARNYQEAAKKGETNNVVSSGSRAENEEFSGVSYEKELEYEDQARDLMGDNAKEESVEAVGRVLASTADSADVDTVLLDPDAKAALEILAPELQDSNLPVKHAEAREVIENVISSREIATRDSRLQEAQDRYAKNIEASLGNMREGAKELLSSNYQNAVSAMGDGSGGIYKELFNRIYIDGTTKGADFEKTYDNIIANNDKAIQEAFPKEFAKKIFDQGRMANVATVAKETAQAKAAKYAEQNKIEAHIEEAAKKYVDQQTFEDIDKFAKRSKVRVEIVEHIVAKDDNGNILYDENGKELRANGKYENGIIYIAADSDNKFITIAKHELTHHIKEISPERYQELEDFVFQRWYNSDFQAMQDAIVKYQKLYQNITLQQAKEEIIADASEAFFTDEGAIQDVCSFSGKLAKALSDGIHSLLDTFLAIQNADKKTRGLGGQFLKQMNILKDAERMWAEALDESVNTDRAAKNGANADLDTEAKHSLGYHAGDLGKSTGDDYWGIKGRSTGHFGFGTYFVGDKMQISDDYYGKRPLESVDFDKYNLFKPRNYEDGERLHDALKKVNDYIKGYNDFSKYFNIDYGTAEADEWYQKAHGINKDLDDFLWDLSSGETPNADVKARIDKFISEMPESNRNKIDSKAQERYEKDDSISLSDWRYYEAQSVVENYTKEWNEKRHKLQNLAWDLVYGLNFHFSQEEIENALKATDRVISKYDNYKRGLDSASTVFMKQLGYEGVDVRGIKGLDNTAYGSVIYDLKGEDLARKKEIGTAKYSISPSLDSDLQDVLKNTFPKSKGEVLIGNTSDFMVNVMEAEPHLVTMPATKAYRAMVTEDEAKAAGRYKESRSEFDNYHGLGRGGLISALEAAEKPVIAFAAAPDYETGDRRYGYIVLVTDQTDSEGNYIVVVQRVDSKGRINKRRVDVNKIITVYGKDYIKGQVQDAIADNRMLFVDKKRSHVIDGGISVRFADGHQSDFKNNINDFWANVNYEKSKGSYSLSYSQDEMDAHRAELENDAEANYGEKYTDDFNESGYVFPNGKMLKMGMYGTRGEDHAMASLAYDDIGYDTYFSPKAEAQKRFINEGNIRYMPENGWLNLGTEIEPTAEQYAWIRRAINNSSEGITRIEFTNMEDSTVDHKDYDRWASASDIINDIKRFYSTGKIGGSELSQFRYSLTASFEAVGCDIRMENGLIKAFNADGTEIKEFKPSDIRKSPLGRLLTLASTETRNRSKILSANDVNNQITFLTKLYNMILNTQDPDLIWAVSGTIGYDPKHALGNTSWLKEAKSKFASITGNADPPKLGNSKRVFLNQKGLTTTAKKTYEKAIANAKRQNRMNGQRLQSTSDFRFEYGLDYLLSFIELEAIGAKAQMYTKVPEAVKFLASTGTEVNCSIMAKGTGLDENGELIFSDITGMSWEDARMLSSMYNNVQPILVAIGREHLIKAMANKFITMIIPYHASGSSEDRYRSMMEAVGEAVEERTDFAEFENEHERADATPEQKLCRKLRVDILTGKFENGSLDAKEKAALKNNEILRQLYIRIYGKDENGNRAKPNRKYVENFDKDGNDSDCLEVYLTKEQAGVMMPYEYWDKQSNIKDADKQGEAYVKYCESLGITPVFSGWDSKGKYDANMDFTSYPGYWKTLIDRCMYNNDGTYHKQKAVSVNNVDLDMLDSNKMKKGIFKPMQTQNTEMTEQIAERSKEKIREEASQSKLSLSESSEAAPTTKEYKSTVKKLEEQVSDLKAEFKRTNLKTADPKQVRIQAGRFLKRHDANNSLHSEVVDTFNKIFGLYKEKGTDAFDEVYEIAQKTAVDVVNSISVIHDEGAEDYKAIKDYLKNTEIKVSDEMKRNITDYNDFRKHNFGRLKLVNGETSNIDNVYMELMEMFPGQFTEDYVNPADQLYHIVDVLDNYAPYYESLDGASEEMQDYVTMVAADLMDTAYGLQTKKTFADRMHSKIEKYQEELWLANERTAAEKMRGEMDVQRAKSEASDSKKKLKEQKQRYEEARKKAIASRKKALDRQKQRYEDKLAAIRESKKKRSERKAESELRSKLLRVAQRLDRLKTTEDNRKQIESLIGELDLVAKSMTMSTVKDIYALRDWYEAMRENDPYFHDSNIEAKLSRLGKKRIADMDINDVRELTDVLLNFEASIRNQNKLIQSEYKKGIKEAGLEVIKDVNESKGVKDNVLGTVDKFFINGTLSPERQIHRITGYNDKDPLYIATKELSKGQREMLTYQMNSWNMFKKFMEDKKFVDSLNGKKAREVSIPCTINGENTEIKVTPDLAISIYLSSLNEDNMRHMGKGGVDIPDIKAYKNGKIKEAFRNSTRVKFTKGQLSKLRHSLTAQEKAFADMAYKYYNEVAPDAINEVSETLKGYSLAKVENYFPIQVNKNFLERDFESLKFDGTIEGMGSLKERVKDQKPIVINGIVDTLTRSIKENSMYVGLAIPVRNFSKLLGVKDVQYSDTQNGNMIDTEVTYNGSVQESIVNKWGDQGMNYIEKFMSDLQTSKASGDDWENVLNKWRSNYAGAVLTLNASVAIKQAASYPTAMAVLGGRPLARAMADVGKVDLDLIEKYTPLQWYRSQGYSTKELGDIRSGRKGSAIDKVTSIPALNWIQGMDLLTTRKLWKASEYYIQEHNKSLKVGTDEYYKAVAEIYNRVIEETQPNYTVMQRPGLLRSDKSMVQMLNMFKTQPYQNFNILYDAIGNYAAKRSRYKADKSSVSQAELKKAFKDLQNATASQVLQLAVFAAMTSLWAIFRGKDKDYEDEEGNLTIESYMKKLAKDMLSGSAAMVPLGADIYNSVSSAITGDYYYGFSSVTDSSISDLFNSLNQTMTLIPSVANYAKDRMPGEPIPDELKKSTLKLAENASRFSGIPYSNVKNLFDGTYRWAAIAGYGEYVGEYLAQKNSMAKDSAMKETLFRAYQNDMDQYNKLRKMMIEDGFKEDSLDSYMKGKKKENKTDSQQTAYDKSMQKLEGSPLWKEASADEQKRYSNIMEKLAVGIDDNDTASYTKKMASGLSAEQIVLYKLALKKVDKPNANGNMGTYTKDEKEAALRLLGASLNSKQKETLMG